MPQDWVFISYTLPSTEYKDCEETSLFIAKEGLNTAITDYNIGCNLTKYSHVDNGGSGGNSVIAYESEEGASEVLPKEKQKKEKPKPYHPTRFMESYHEEYLSYFRDNKKANYQALGTKKIQIGKYKGLASEFTYYHEGIEFMGDYHCYLITLVYQHSLVSMQFEGDIRLWDAYKEVFYRAVKTIEL
jgi:hypothetical protein